MDYGLAHRGAVPARGCTGLQGAQFGGVCACECSGVFWTEARVPRTDACAQDRCACGGVLHGVARCPVARACVCVRACARARACSGAARMKSAQTATVASSCIETNAKTLRRKPGQPERSNSVSPASKRRGLSLRSHRVALSRQVGLRGGCRPHGLLRNRAIMHTLESRGGPRPRQH